MSSDALMEFYFQDKKEEVTLGSQKSLRLASTRKETTLKKLDAIKEEIAYGSLGRIGKLNDHK